MKPLLFLLPLLLSAAALAAGQHSPSAREANSLPPELQWPAPTRENRPWTRWWWLGSAVDRANLSRLLREYRDAGIGGVEICPIYGVNGYEDRFLPFLSPQWLDALAHTTREAKRLDLGVDLTTGTGWPFGGPMVSPEDASSKVVLKRFDVAGGARLSAALPEGRLQCLRAVSAAGEQVDLTAKAAGGRVHWTAPAGEWKVYAVVESGPVQKVKRAAPGGEGSVLDPYSVAALDRYLSVFDRAFEGYRGETPRSHFHDSFEYYGAQWTPEFFREFQARRGYDLRTQLPAFFGEGPADTVARVLGDYRATLNDLHLAYIRRWTEWCHRHGSLSRDQAHGAPANLLDLYAASDIPETEIFGALAENKVPLNKFASSAAHVSGRRLSSSESFTWLNEHFHASLSQVKQAADYLFLTGVNHVFFHGIPYSPAEAQWPGWQFYAAVNFGPQGGLWQDLPEFNAYVTRCQSVLQSGAPSADVLLYHPLHDLWNGPGNLILPSPIPKALETAAERLWQRGYAFDYLSDAFLEQAKAERGQVVLGGNPYRVVLVPQCRLMPVETLRRLVELARAGATVLFQGGLPADVPGLGDLEKRRAALREVLAGVRLEPASGGLRRAAVGTGAIVAGPDLDALLQEARVPREAATDQGLWFIRRTHPEGYHYFFANRGEKPVDGWVTLGTPARSAVLLDPRSGSRAGVAEVRRGPDGARQVYLQLLPGESCILRTYTSRAVKGPAWEYLHPSGEPRLVTGTWQVRFLEGGPALPAAFETGSLGTWTDRDDPEAKRFAGTALYRLEFDRPEGAAEDWVLDLGKVAETARVRLNGRPVGALWSAPFRVPVGEYLLPGKNTLEVEVANLAANRIADLDRRGEKWKIFYDINVASKTYGQLDASRWPLVPSGLLGPVTLQPVRTR